MNYIVNPEEHSTIQSSVVLARIRKSVLTSDGCCSPLAVYLQIYLFYSNDQYYRVEEKYASATVHYKTITFWETPFMNSNFGSYQK